jgi:hypothetical protein
LSERRSIDVCDIASYLLGRLRSIDLRRAAIRIGHSDLVDHAVSAVPRFAVFPSLGGSRALGAATFSSAPALLAWDESNTVGNHPLSRLAAAQTCFCRCRKPFPARSGKRSADAGV